MILQTLLIGIVFALIFSLIFALGFRRPGPWPNFWIFFVIVLLAVVAGGLWITPTGPVLWGVYWVPLFMIALLVSLFLAAATPEQRPRTRTEAIRKAEEENAAAAAFGVFFWILIIVFLVVILFRLIW